MSIVEWTTAKKLYTNYANNHPTIHCNRFAPWDELPQAAKDEWLHKARKRISFEEDDGA